MADDVLAKLIADYRSAIAAKTAAEAAMEAARGVLADATSRRDDCWFAVGNANAALYDHLSAIPADVV